MGTMPHGDLSADAEVAGQRQHLVTQDYLAGAAPGSQELQGSQVSQVDHDVNRV